MSEYFSSHILFQLNQMFLIHRVRRFDTFNKWFSRSLFSLVLSFHKSVPLVNQLIEYHMGNEFSEYFTSHILLQLNQMLSIDRISRCHMSKKWFSPNFGSFTLPFDKQCLELIKLSSITLEMNFQKSTIVVFHLDWVKWFGSIEWADLTWGRNGCQ